MNTSNVSFRAFHKMLTREYPFEGDESVKVRQVAAFLLEVHQKISELALSEETKEMVNTLPTWLKHYETCHENALVAKADLVWIHTYLARMGSELWREHAENKEQHCANHAFKNGPLQPSTAEVTGDFNAAASIDQGEKLKSERANSKRFEAVGKAARAHAVPIGVANKGRRVFPKPVRKWS